VKRRDLLIAMADLEPIEVHGEFGRHMSLRWDELTGSPAGGRWGAPRAFQVLYLGRPRDSIVIEAYRHLVDDELDDASDLAAQVVERRVITCDVDVTNILDLREPETLRALGLSSERLRSPVGDYDDCQRVGAAAHQLRLGGILAPAATGFGETLALFSTNVPVDQWPRVTARALWNGLPPDPRQLRAVDDANSR
jgi:RES domain-containing protein